LPSGVARFLQFQLEDGFADISGWDCALLVFALVV